MPIIPDKKVEQLQFCESHWPVWTANAVGIGVSLPQCNTLKTLTQAARTAFDAAQNAKQAYHAAVTAQDAALRQAVTNAADLIRVIKGFAELTGNPDAVYSLAQIPPPASPTPAQPPGKPTSIAVTLEPTGAVTLSWEAANASAGSGGYFTLSRKLPGQAGFTILGAAPGATTEQRRMSFTDATIPTSAAGQGAQYIIQGQRGALVGDPSDAVTVQFGVDSNGAAFAGIKIAA